MNTIMPVSTATALFIGQSRGGPIGEPVLCTNYTEFKTAFGEDTVGGELPIQVKLFFANGGAQCWVLRLAAGAQAAAVTLDNEAVGATTPVAVLTLTAKAEGQTGNAIRALVDYNTALPESTFNLTVYTLSVDSQGNTTKTGLETHRNLSMNPNLPTYAPTFVSQNSLLVDAAVAGSITATLSTSLGGRLWDDTTAYGAAGDLATTGSKFLLSLGGSAPAPVTVSLASAANQADVANQVNAALQSSLSAAPGIAPADLANLTASAVASSAAKRWFLSFAHPSLDVLISPAPGDGFAIAAMLGAAQGGVEVGAYAPMRPAASGVTWHVNTNAYDALAAAVAPAAATSLVVDGNTIPIPALSTGAGALWADDTIGFAGVTTKLDAIATAFNNYAAVTPMFPWTAQVWGARLALLANKGDNYIATTAPTASGLVDASQFVSSTPAYSLGVSGVGPFQGSGAPGIDGTNPKRGDYTSAQTVIDQQVDLFNLLILPEQNPPFAAGDLRAIYQDASAYCLRRRALLLVDPPAAWTTAQQAASGSGVGTLRQGIVADHAALYFPRLTYNQNGVNIPVNPSGAMAGVMSRIDTARGVWKAPAGLEADLRSISGLERRFSDGDNGVLNPAAINTLRVFPDGIVCWGARTLAGSDTGAASDYKYVPVRRTALFIEESLYRGLQWVVFEGNAEPLWAQIRLNVGAFMNGLFRQGAFAGTKPTDAYFVKCDSETTTQTDVDQGVVNIWVGFAPLKPAEFVVLSLQQMAGQIQV
nr:phage tail sheath C-terminal domain-containing protein [Kofleriaceae bacterium]